MNNEFSDWYDVFIVSKLGKFADDTKLCREIFNNNDADILRSDLNPIYQWSLNWQMLFNADKCSVLYLGDYNKEYDYKLGCNVIRSSATEKDLGELLIDPENLQSRVFWQPEKQILFLE